jgi:hypothetical protein
MAVQGIGGVVVVEGDIPASERERAGAPAAAPRPDIGSRRGASPPPCGDQSEGHMGLAHVQARIQDRGREVGRACHPPRPSAAPCTLWRS